MTGAGDEKLARLERDWKTMILIAHDFFHAWRRVVAEKYGEAEMEELTEKFWELVGRNTANQYRTKGKIDAGSVEQIVRAVARSSEIMGETVRVEREGEAWLLIHEACPWIETYRRAGYPGRCQRGCDRWFSTTVAELTPEVVVETTSCLAAGDGRCVRRFYRHSCR